MRPPLLAAISDFHFNLALTVNDIWVSSPAYVAGNSREAEDAVLESLGDITRQDANLGVAVRGAVGSGKTHMLAWVRDKAHAVGGYFLVAHPLGGFTFWDSLVHGVIDSLNRDVIPGQTQLATLLRRLSSAAGAPSHIRAAMMGEVPLTVETLDEFEYRLGRYAPEIPGESHGTARALALFAASDSALQDVGYSYLLSQMESQPGEFAAWGLPSAPRTAELVFDDLMQLLALTGPSIIGIDQIDTAVALTAAHTPNTAEPDLTSPQLLAEGIAALIERKHRTLAIAACLPPTWELLCQTPDSSLSRLYRVPAPLARISGGHAYRIIASRFETHYRRLNFTPPYPTWPVTSIALEQAEWSTPRRLLREVQDFLQGCLADGNITELREFNTALTAEPRTLTAPVIPALLVHLDARFSDLRKAADTVAALDPAHEDQTMAEFLAAGLQAWIIEQPDSHLYAVDPSQPGGKAPLHARLRRFSSATQDAIEEIHWSFRAIATPHAISALSRIQAASVAAGLSEHNTNRNLILLRNLPWPAGRRTEQTIGALAQVGTRTIPIDNEDLRILTALRAMMLDADPSLHEWIRTRKPTADIRFLDAALSISRDTTVGLPPYATTATEPALAHDRPAIKIGHFVDTRRPTVIALEDLRRHTVIFAGNGSGKTVLLRRIVEECALQGVSAIVLDPNNELARLGEPWPHEPAGWAEGDPTKAEAYLEHTEVTVWTPHRTDGRPLQFEPLPIFAAINDDPDELAAALDAAVASLAPRMDIDGPTLRAVQCRAVLKEALQYTARTGVGNLRQLLALLAELPPGVSTLSKAPRLAAEMADLLSAVIVNDPLFRGAGQAHDPGALLTPSPGKRARVSVISFLGLTSDVHRYSFVNQLQMALFSWIKQHPAGNRPLAGLLVMDEAQTLVPSGATVACTQSTLALASQGRRYGLGLVFATQAPKGLHNQIPGNAATQFFGFLGAPVQIAAARELALAKGAVAIDISRLGTGQFYLAAHDAPIGKVQTPMSLSYHPPGPLTPEEILDRASTS